MFHLNNADISLNNEHANKYASSYLKYKETSNSLSIEHGVLG